MKSSLGMAITSEFDAHPIQFEAKSDSNIKKKMLESESGKKSEYESDLDRIRRKDNIRSNFSIRSDYFVKYLKLKFKILQI